MLLLCPPKTTKQALHLILIACVIKISCQQNDWVIVYLKATAALLCVVVSVATIKSKSLPEAY